MYPLASYVKANIPATIASDNPVTDFNPLKGLVGAMTRMTETGTIVGPEERISLLEAIRMYTWNAAYASFQEHLIGSIEVGKKADVVILDRSILKTPVEALLEIKVQSTIIDGEIVFSTQPLRSKV